MEKLENELAQVHKFKLIKIPQNLDKKYQSRQRHNMVQGQMFLEHLNLNWLHDQLSDGFSLKVSDTRKQHYQCIF